jgi:hypothetical protein
VPPGKTLTINPGVIVKFSSTSSKLTVVGAQRAYGTSGSKIYLTSIKDDAVGGDTDATSVSPAAGDWDAVEFDSGASSTIANAVVRYGGYRPDGNTGVAIYNNGGVMTLDNTEVATSTDFDVYQESSTG